MTCCDIVDSACTHVVQGNQWSSPSPGITDGEENTVLPDRGCKLLDEKYQKPTRNDGQVEVVDEEKVVEFECGPCSHQFSASEDNGVVGNQDCRSSRKCQHRYCSGGNVQFVGWISHGRSPYAVEYSPWREVTKMHRFGIEGGLGSIAIRHCCSKDREQLMNCTWSW